jgi:hypothetical protein
VGEPDPAAQAHAERRQAMYVERPVDRATLLCLVAMAVGEGRPVRRSPRKRVARFEAVVEGTPSFLLDVSNEGLRLESPAGRRSAPPYFSVQVPLIGVTLLVQRIWTSQVLNASGRAVALAGAALAANPARVERAWRAFVAAIPGGA